MNTINYNNNDFRKKFNKIFAGTGIVFGTVVSSSSDLFYEKPEVRSRFFVTYLHNNLEPGSEHFGTRRTLSRENESVFDHSTRKIEDKKRTTRVQWKNKHPDIPTKKWWVGIKTYPFYSSTPSTEEGEGDEFHEKAFYKCHGSSREWLNKGKQGQKFWSWSTFINTINNGETPSPFVDFSTPRHHARKAYIPNTGDTIAYSTHTGNWAIVSKECAWTILFSLSNKNIISFYNFNTDKFPLTIPRGEDEEDLVVSFHDYVDRRIFRSSKFQTDPFGMWLFGLYMNCESMEDIHESFTLKERRQLMSWSTISSEIAEIEYTKSFDFYKAFLSICLKGDIPTAKNYPKHDNVTFNSLSKFYPFDYDKWMCNPSLIERCLQAFSWGSERVSEDDFWYDPSYKKFHQKFGVEEMYYEDEEEEVYYENVDCIDDDGNEVLITLDGGAGPSSWANIVKKSMEEKGLSPPTSLPPSPSNEECGIVDDDELSEF